MAEHQHPVTASAHDPLDAVRTWSITLGIAAFVLTVMYTSAFVHYGAPHFENPESVIADLSRG